MDKVSPWETSFIDIMVGDKVLNNTGKIPVEETIIALHTSDCVERLFICWRCAHTATHEMPHPNYYHFCDKKKIGKMEAFYEKNSEEELNGVE